MGWILSCIDRLHMSAASNDESSTPASTPGDGNFHVAMMPLGTGEMRENGAAGGGGQTEDENGQRDS